MNLRPATLSLVLTVAMIQAASGQTVPDWVKRSNENSAILLEVQARFSPEGVAAIGT